MSLKVQNAAKDKCMSHMNTFSRELMDDLMVYTYIVLINDFMEHYDTEFIIDVTEQNEFLTD